MNYKPMFTIGVMSELLEVHQRTLRIYDKEKILSPKRSGKNRRLYSYNDLEKAKLILYLTRNLALNLSGVKIMLGILDELNISTVEYMLLIKKISNDKNINEDENISKSFKKGRKIKKDL